VWNDETGASGGGESAVFARPRYQLGPGLPALGARRALPDLALAASPHTPGYVIVEDGRARIIGGTSAGAPALAGVLALVNERLTITQGTSGLGQLLPALYRLGGEQARGLRAPVFRDVQEGTNALPGAPGFPSTPGFDLATGWGAPLADALVSALEGPGRCEPEIGCLVPARGARERACAGAWLVEQDVFAVRNGVPRINQTCHDGDPQCDADGTADGRCTVNVSFCLNIFDFRSRRLDRRGLPACEPGLVRRVRLGEPRARRRDPLGTDNRRALKAALGALPELPTRLRNACTAGVPVVVPVRGPGSRGRTMLRARVDGSLGRTRALLALRCRAR
jgi:hypothetical protein